jgi:hypothetical protein
MQKRLIKGAVVTVLLALSIFTSQAATRSWINTAGGSWTNGANWSPAGVPQNGDVVFITNNGTYTVTLNASRDLNALTIGGTSGKQTLLVTNATLDLTNGTVRANGELTLQSGGLRRRLTIANGGILNFNNPGTHGLYSLVLINNGTVNWNGGTLLGGSTPTTLVTNAGLWNINSDELFGQGIGGPDMVFVNTGTLRKVGGSGATTLQNFHFVNLGSVEAQSGWLDFGNGQASRLGGTFTTSAGANLRLNGGTFTETGGSFGGAGTNRFISGTLTLSSNILPGLLLVGGDVQVASTFQQAGAITNLTLDGSRLIGTNRVGNGTLRVNDGGLTHRLTVQAGGTLLLSSNATKSLYGSTLINQGTVNWTGGTLLGGSTPTTLITNSGLWQIISDELFGQGIGGPDMVFVNTGTLRKIGGSGTTTLQNFHFVNSGSVEVQSGILDFGNSRGSRLGGIFTTSVGANLRLNGGTLTDAGGSFGGGGTNRFTAGTLSLSNNILPGLLLTGGDIFIGPGFQQAGAITNLTLSGSRLIGTNHVGNGTLTLNDGGLNGRLTVQMGGTLTLASNVTKTLYGLTLINQGTVNWTGGTLLGGSTPTTSITNSGLWQINSDELFGQGIGGPDMVFVNTGTLRKIGGSGTTTLQNFHFVNSGSVEVQSGILDFGNSRGSRLGGNFTTSAGANLRLNGGTLTEAGGSFSGPGTNRFISGTLTLSNNILPGLALTGGDVQLASTFQQAGAITNLTLSGARLIGTNRIGSGTLLVNDGGLTGWLTVEASGALTFASAATKSLYGLTLMNHGTVSWNGGTLLGGSTPTTLITNSGLWQINSDELFGQGIGGPVMQFVNAGTLRKAASAGTSTIQNFQFNNTGLIEVLSGRLNLPGGAVQSAGTTRLAGGNLGASGTYQLLGGVMEGTGEFFGTLLNAAQVRPNYPGVLRVSGSYTQAPSGTLRFRLGGTAAGTTHAQLQVTSGFHLQPGASASSAVAFELAPGSTPNPGDLFTVVTYASRNAETTNLHNATLSGSGASLRIDVASTSLRLVTLDAAPAPRLSIDRLGAQLVVSWPTNVSGYRLQATRSLNPISWTNVPGVGPTNRHQFTPTPNQSYFRLINP